MIDVEVFGADLAPEAPPPREIRGLCARAAASRGLDSGHLAIEFVGAPRIAELNLRHRGEQGPTDVLSFPLDGIGGALTGAPGPGARGEARGQAPPPRELGDIVICPQHTHDVREAIVHGMLHLLGMDHERDDGEMLALQEQLLAATRE